MPELQHVKEEYEEELPPPRTSTLSDVSVTLSQSGDRCATTNSDMAQAATDLV